MRRLSGWILTVIACLAVAASITARSHDAQERRGNPPAVGRGRVQLPLPDLTVTGGYKPGYTCENGKLGLTLRATITNEGAGPAVLASNWTKPWVSAHPSVSIPGFVKPYQTGAKTVTLKAGAYESVEFNAILGPAPGGVGYDLILEVDPSNAIKETNEKNNTSKISIPAKICG
jgi:hypothetical protein